MNKKELCNALAERTGLTKTEAQKAFNAVIEIITNEMKTEWQNHPYRFRFVLRQTESCEKRDESDFFRPD